MSLPLFHWTQVVLMSALMLVLGYILARTVRHKPPSHANGPDTQTAITTPALEHLQAAFKAGQLSFDESLELATAYRRKGDLEQAIVIHQSLYGQPGLDWQHLQRAQYELAKDFFQAGIFSRAEDLLETLSAQKGSLQPATAKLLVRLYVHQKDWLKAATLFKSHPHIIDRSLQWTYAHILCEQAQLELLKNPHHAQHLLELAQQRHPTSLRPDVVLLNLFQQQKRWGDWFHQLQHFLKLHPQRVDLIKKNLFAVLKSQPSLHSKISTLLKSLSQESSIRLLRAEWALTTHSEAEAIELIKSVELNWDTLLLRINQLAQELKHPELSQLDQKLQQANIKRLRYRCSHCGYEALQHRWQCPQCERWETLEPSDLEPNQQKLL